MKKRIISLILVGTMAMMMAACGTKTEENVEGTDQSTGVVESVDLGTPTDVLDILYAEAALNTDLKEQIENGAFEQGELDESMAPVFLGEADVDFVSGVASMPMMSSIAYQVVVLQVEEGQDLEATKTELVEKADTGKWVCVEPESVVAVNNGNYVLFIMADEATADALVETFQNL